VFLLRAHIGNYSLFISGIFHENAQRRRDRGGPDLKFYEQVGRTNYQLVAGHEVARRCELDDVFEGLAERFHDVRLALNELSDRSSRSSKRSTMRCMPRFTSSAARARSARKISPATLNCRRRWTLILSCSCSSLFSEERSVSHASIGAGCVFISSRASAQEHF